jgi:hypothetical protein
LTTQLVNVTGNGTIVNGSISNFSYSEDVTSLEPSTINGGLQQVNATIVGDGSGTKKDSLLLINNDVKLIDTEYGELPFRVKKVSKNNDLISISGNTLSSRLNVIKTALPLGGEGANLYTALQYYCELVDITPVIDSEFATELEQIAVNFIGWDGNVWDHLKMLCAAVSVDSDNNVGIEMYIDGEELKFRKALQQSINLTAKSSDISFEVDSFDAAKSIEIYNYNTSYGTDRVIYSQSNYDGSLVASARFQNSIDDSLQVNAGETLTKRFKISASLNEVNQPVAVSTINRTPPFPYDGITGEYVIVGVDDIPVNPDQWRDLGGNLEISLYDKDGNRLPADEIEITITAPSVPNLPHAENAAEVGLSPYKIGVESSGTADYPALWITGTGVFFEKKLETYYTGTATEYTSNDVAITIDNPFITNSFLSTSRGVAAAQVACGPRITISQSISDGLSFGQAAGSTQIIDNNVYRISAASFNPGSISLTSIPAATIANFNSVWTGKTFTQFNAIMGTELWFNEFSIIPLNKDA